MAVSNELVQLLGKEEESTVEELYQVENVKELLNILENKYQDNIPQMDNHLFNMFNKQNINFASKYEILDGKYIIQTEGLSTLNKTDFTGLIFKGDYDFYQEVVNFINKQVKDYHVYDDVFTFYNNTNFYRMNDNKLENFKKNILKVQVHEHPFYYKEEETVRKKITKEDVNLKRGYLLYCDECKAFEPCEVYAMLECVKTETWYTTLTFVPVYCVCSNCGKEIIAEDIKKYHYLEKISNAHFYNSYLFKNEDEKKIKLSVLEKNYNCYHDKINFEFINNSVVFNIETGRTYLLPSYNLNTKRKKGAVRALGSYQNAMIPYNFYVQKEYVHEIGKTIEDHNRVVDSKGLIAFEDYYKDAIEYIGNSELSNKTFNGKDIVSRETLYILINYNANPYITFKQHSIVDNMRRVHNLQKLKRIKKIKNKALYNQTLVKANMTDKFSKKYIESTLYTMQFRYNEVFEPIQIINNNVLDINNKLKLLNIINKSSNSCINFSALESLIYHDLVNRHSEKDVINALIKDDNYFLLRDTIYAYKNLKTMIPEYAIPVRRLRLKDIHDKVNSDYNKLKHVKKVYEYNSEIVKEYNRTVNGIEFKLASSNHELIEIGSSMNICVGSYSYRVENKTSTIITMIQNNEYVGCLQFNELGELVQAKAIRNNLLKGELLTALLEYCMLTNTRITTMDVESKYRNTIEVKDKSLICKILKAESSQDNDNNITKEKERYLKILIDQRTTKQIMNDEPEVLVDIESLGIVQNNTHSGLNDLIAINIPF